jgi:hypothetical protein
MESPVLESLMSLGGFFGAPVTLAEIDLIQGAEARREVLLANVVRQLDATGVHDTPHHAALAQCRRERAFLAGRRADRLARLDTLRASGPPSFLDVVREELATFTGSWRR